MAPEYEPIEICPVWQLMPNPLLPNIMHIGKFPAENTEIDVEPYNPPFMYKLNPLVELHVCTIWVHEFIGGIGPNTTIALEPLQVWTTSEPFELNPIIGKHQPPEPVAAVDKWKRVPAWNDGLIHMAME